MSPSPSTSTVTLQVDGHARDVAPGTTLAQLVEALGHAPQAVSTAVNAEFVARAARGDRVLRAGDQVLLFQPIVGG
ncbi:sulfur carrier protein ThiS [Ottowia pentelensis]|uniref:Sulfur carrier protein ThiS n=1 Tax=Ottowia pentelensis TaxID=511108 RepID=A0ABV6PR17_9BURK|nr:sulfur carrier protein ThiS [Ottowia sp.]